MKYLPLALAALLCNISRDLIATSHASASATSSTPQPVYLVAGWDFQHSERMRHFNDAVVPLAQKAGLQMMAVDKARVLEGKWPFGGVLILERYDSMQALKKFWYSKQHAEIKKLREGVISSHFVVAVEAEQ